MQKANPLKNNSMSSNLAELLLSCTAIESTLSSQLLEPAARKDFAKEYTERVRQHASAPELWGDVANVLNVEIDSTNNVQLTMSGSDEDLYRASELEYGTPSSPPKSIIRTFSESLRYDLQSDMAAIDL